MKERHNPTLEQRNRKKEIKGKTQSDPKRQKDGVRSKNHQYTEKIKTTKPRWKRFYVLNIYVENLLRIVLKRLKRHNFPEYSISMYQGFSCPEWYFTAVGIMLLVRIWRTLKLSGIPSI